MDADLMSQTGAAQAQSGEGERAQSTTASSAAQSQPQPPAQPPAQSQAQAPDLVSSLSSWWGGLSKSATASLEQARTNLESSSRGLVQAARDELHRFEQSLEQAQAQAQAQSKAKQSSSSSSSAAPQGEETAGGAGTGAKGKGKARAQEVEEGDAAGYALDGDDIEGGAGANVTTVDANGDIVGGSDPVQGPGSPRASRRSFNGGADNDDQERGKDAAGPDAKGQAEGQAQSQSFDLDRSIEQQLARASSLFSQLTTSIQNDPRVRNLQTSLTALGKQAGERVSAVGAGTGAGAASAAEDGSKEGAAAADGSAAKAGSGDLLSSLSTTIQSSLPHLSWQESQALAEKYWHKSEEFAKEIVHEVRGLAEDLVQVVPPPGGEAGAGAAEGKSSREVGEKSKGNSQTGAQGEQLAAEVVFDAEKPSAAPKAPASKETAAAAAAPAPAAPASTADAAAVPKSADALQTATLPPTGGWGDSDDDSSAAPAKTAAAASGKAAPGKEVAVGKEKADDEDEDSDWE